MSRPIKRKPQSAKKYSDDEIAIRPSQPTIPVKKEDEKHDFHLTEADIEQLFKEAEKQPSGTPSEESGDEKCSHINKHTNDAGAEFCTDCGVQLDSGISQDQEWRYYGESDNKHSSDPSRVQYKKNPEKGIRKDLERLNIPIEVVNRADDYYYEVTKGDIKRSNLRRGIIFACVFQAYKDLNQPQVPDQLINVFKLNRKAISKGLIYFKMRCNRIPEANQNYITPRNFIPGLLEKFQVTDEHVQIIMELYDKIEHRSSLINKSNPNSVSAGLIYYYFKKNNIDISASKFGKIAELSEITVQKIANEIEAIFERANA